MERLRMAAPFIIFLGLLALVFLASGKDWVRWVQL